MGFFSSEPIMRWKEPSPIQRDKTNLIAGIGLMVISAALAIILALTHHFPKGEAIFWMLAPGLFGAGNILLDRAYSAVVVLKENRINRVSGRIGSYSDYNDIESCIVTRKKFPRATFFHLEFTQKEEKTFSIAPPITGVLVPNDVDLNFVLDILRNKGIKIIENYEK